MPIYRSISAVVCTATMLCGCGLHVPEKTLFLPNTRVAQGDYENTIVSNIKCELHKGVQDTLAFFAKAKRAEDVSWLRDWGATVTLKISVEEKGAVNPTVDVVPSSTFSLGLGGGASSDATRTETVEFSYAFSDLLKEHPVETCNNEDGVTIHSNLKIGDFIFDKAFIASVPSTLASPFTVFNYQATFVTSFSAKTTPTWKFTKVSVDPSGDLLSFNRTKTNDVVITLAKAKPATAVVPAKISNEGAVVHQAAVIGQAVATAIQSQQR